MTALRRGLLPLALLLFAACDSPSPPKDGVPHSFSLVSGTPQTGLAGEALAQPLVVKVVDHAGTPVAGGTVTFTQGDTASGQPSTASATSGADGLATVTWTLGKRAGAHTMVASSSLKGNDITFTATAQPNGRVAGTITVGDPVSALLAGNALASLARDTEFRAGRRVRGGFTAFRAKRPLRYSDDALIVTFKQASLSAPAIGSRAMRSAQTAATLARGMRDRLGRHAALPMRVADVSPALLSARVRVSSPARLDEVRAALLRDASVASVSRDARAQAYGQLLPNDEAYVAQQWHYELLDLPRAWGMQVGNRTALIAVVDDGIRFDHPDIAANLTSDGYDFASSFVVPFCGGGTVDLTGDGGGYDADPTIPKSYEVNAAGTCVQESAAGAHGLHVAGTIGAMGNNAIGSTGINWNVRIRPVRVLNGLGDGTYFDIAQGILYAAGLPASNGQGGTVQAPSAAQIINLSLGGPTDEPVLRSAVQAAAAAGSLIVAAAGNDGTSTVGYPAAYPEVLAVSAVGPDGVLASYSTFGTAVDIAAPGGDFDLGNESHGVLSLAWDFSENSPALSFAFGTSMASPHVAGVAALLLAQQPGMTAAQLRARLLDWAVDQGAPGNDIQYGAGVVHARNSLAGNRAPATSLFARVYNSATGAFVAQAAANAQGAFSVGGLADGDYWVAGAEDEDGDGLTGLPGRRWGSLGGIYSPAVVAVRGAGQYPATFSILRPAESEPNNAQNTGNRLLLGGIYTASLSSALDEDYYRVTVPGGVYTFETGGLGGGCGFGLAADTHLTVFGPTGSTLGSNEDINESAFRYCSRVTLTLAAGTYMVRVRTDFDTPGGYYVWARAG
ncbi:MAG TPA: S8 family serine peptidase [Longimicrobium sp.]|nr:S8 family serine peptidase [Longimicrobium sp.]